MLPNFICIGTYRAGTTWLNSVLSEHSEIFVPSEKELMFFSRYYDRGIDWYRKFFRNAGDSRIIAEICPTYLSHPAAPGLIKRHIPDVKLFACLRNPVDQVYSHYNLGVTRGRYTKPLASLINDRSFPALIHAFHAKYIKGYLEHFDKSQMLILLYDDLVNDPKGFLKSIYHFLNVREYYPKFLNERVNYSRIPRLACLDVLIAKVGTMLRDYNLLGLKMTLNKLRISDKLKRINSNRITTQPMDSGLRVHLNRLFETDKQQLELLIGRDLSGWL